MISSHVLQQPIDYSRLVDRIPGRGGLVVRQYREEFPNRFQKCHFRSHDLHRPFFNLHLILIGVVCSGDLLHHLFHGWLTQQASDCYLRSHIL